MFSSKLRGAVALPCASALVFFVGPVAAQTSTGEDVFITANRWSEATTAIHADVHVLKRADIERSGADSLPDLLSKLPGVQAISYGDNAVYTRGAESRMTALYIDGVRIESHDGLRMGGGAPWGAVPLDMIERVEVVKGPMGALYGSDAMGGVVQIFTKQAGQGVSKQVSVGLGSQGTYQAAAGLSGAAEEFSYSLRVGEKQSDGYNTRPDKVHTPAKEGWTDRFANVRLGWRFHPDHSLEWVTVVTDRDEKLAAPYSGVIDIRQQSSLQASSLKWQGQWSAGQTSQIQWTQGRNAVKSDAPNLYDSPNDFRTVTEGLLAQHRMDVPVGQLTFMAERKTDKFVAQPTSYDPLVNGQRTQSAGGLGYALIHGEHSLKLNVRSDHYDGIGSRNTYAAGYAWNLAPSWTLGVSRSTGFKAPTVEQTYGQYGSVSLKPETNTSNEVSIERRLEQSKWRATWFDTKVENLISSSQSLNTCSAGWFCYYNVGQASMRGLTLSGQTQVSGVQLDASYDYLDAMDEVRQKQLSLRAKNQFKLAASQDIQGYRTGAQIQLVGRKFDDADNSHVLPGYGLLNLFVQKRLAPEWTWLARLNNVLDHHYQQFGCAPSQCVYAAPGRTFFTSIAWSPRN